jgi:hypothetical protein
MLQSPEPPAPPPPVGEQQTTSPPQAPGPGTTPMSTSNSFKVEVGPDHHYTTVTNQRELFICLDLMIKNREVEIL